MVLIKEVGDLTKIYVDNALFFEGKFVTASVLYRLMLFLNFEVKMEKGET